MKFKRHIDIAQALATGIAQKALPHQLGQQACRRSFAQKLVELRGIPMKLSQILSGGTHENANVHREALQNIKAMDMEQVLQLLQERCPELLQQLESISEQAHPASLGQVHQVHISSNASQHQALPLKKTAALKVQYPQMDEHMNLDERLMGLLVQSMPSFKEGFSLSDYQSTIHRELQEELDYLKEAQKLQQLHDAFQSHPNIVVPAPHLAFCGPQHLLMDWEDSITIDDFCASSSLEEKMSASQSLCTFFFTSFFKAHLVHADPNPGNYGLRIQGREVQWVIYDAGSVFPTPPSSSLIILKCLQCVVEGKGDLLPLLVELGFQAELLKPCRHQLLAFFDLLFEPFLSMGRYRLSDWDRKHRASQILGEHRWNFMAAAPSDFLLPMRFIQGLISHLEKINVGVYTRAMVEDLFHERRHELLDLDKKIQQHPLSIQRERNSDHSELKMAEHLRIEVIENGELKVQMTLPRASINDIHDLIDDDLKHKLEQDRIDLDDILAKVRENGYRPMECFKVLKDNGKQVSISLV